MSNSSEQLKKIFVDKWAAVLHDLLGRDVTLAINSVQVKAKKDIVQLIRGLHSFISIRYGDAPGEVIVLGVRNKLISIVANLMIGLESFQDDIAASDKDAFIEAVTQIFTACQAPLKESLDMDLRFRDATFVQSRDPLPLIAGNNVELWIITMTVTGTAAERFIMLTPENFSEESGEDDDHISKIMMDPLVTQPNIPHISTARPSTAQPPPRSPSSPNPTNPPNPPNPFNPSNPSNPTNPRPRSGAGAVAGVGPGVGNSNIDLLMDVEIPVTVRIGNAEMRLMDIMRLGLGSIIELEKMVDDPVEILANGKLVARGEVVVCDGHYAVKITEVQSKAERIRSLA